MGGAKIKIFRRSDLPDHTIAQNNDTISQRQSFILIMRHINCNASKVLMNSTNFLPHFQTQFGVKIGMIKIDPTLGVKIGKARSDGFRTWNEDDIAAFEARHPIGTKERLALALMLYTVQRRGDVIRMGRQHVRDGMIAVRQNKTGTTLSIPMHPALRAVLDATPSDHLTFLTTSFGKPFVAAGFTNWFREACNEAGLPRGTSAHGLRKAGCRRLAEAGCSANIIASISGHASLGEVTRYTKAADQVRMAKDGMAMLVSEAERRTKVSTPSVRFDKKRK